MKTNSYSAAMFMSWVLSQGVLTCPFPNVHPRCGREFANCYSMMKDFPLLATELSHMSVYSREWRAVVENWTTWSEFLIAGNISQLSEVMAIAFQRLNMPAKRRNNCAGPAAFRLSDNEKAFIKKSHGRLSLTRIAAVLDRPYSTIVKNAKLLQGDHP